MTKTSISDPELQQGLNSGNKRKPWQIVFLVPNSFIPMSLKSIFDVSEGALLSDRHAVQLVLLGR